MKEMAEKESALRGLRARLDELEGQLNANTVRSKSEAHLALVIREALEAKLQSTSTEREAEKLELVNQIDTLKKQYFFTLTLALKLSKAAIGEACNLETEPLYQAVLSAQIPIDQWPLWLTSQMKRN